MYIARSLEPLFIQELNQEAYDKSSKDVWEIPLQASNLQKLYAKSNDPQKDPLSI